MLESTRERVQLLIRNFLENEPDAHQVRIIDIANSLGLDSELVLEVLKEGLDPRIITCAGAAKWLKCTEQRVRQIAAQLSCGMLHNSVWMFNRSDLQKMAARRTTPGPRRGSGMFTEELVETVSAFLQNHMQQYDIESMTADECAQLLADNDLLPNSVGPKPGFNFRQMLRDGRDGKIPLVTGATQERPNTRWRICRSEGSEK